MPRAIETRSGRKPPEPSLAVLISGLLGELGRYADTESALLRADLESTFRRSTIVAILFVGAMLLALVGLLVLAQAGVAALSPLAGGEAYAGLIVGAGLLGAVAALLWISIGLLGRDTKPKSAIMRALSPSHGNRERKRMSVARLTTDAQRLRAELTNTTATLRNRLTPAQLAEEIVVALESRLGSRPYLASFASRHPIVAGAIITAVTWLLLPEQFRATDRRPEKKRTPATPDAIRRSSDAYKPPA